MNRLEKLEREIEIRKLAQARYAPCGGHVGKAPGGCLMCEIERLRDVIDCGCNAIRDAVALGGGDIKRMRREMFGFPTFRQLTDSEVKSLKEDAAKTSRAMKGLLAKRREARSVSAPTPEDS